MGLIFGLIVFFGGAVNISIVLLSIVCFLLFFVVILLSKLNFAFVSMVKILATELGHDFQKSQDVRNDILDEIKERGNELADLKTEVSEIRYVTDVIYKYKLPNEEQQLTLDEIEFLDSIKAKSNGEKKT
jgi:hypothetical protein